MNHTLPAAGTTPGSYNFDQYAVNNQMLLDPNTNYTVRIYVYVNPAANGTTAEFNDFHIFFNDHTAGDTDGDGIANHLDLDSDNDGIRLKQAGRLNRLVESRALLDSLGRLDG